MAKRYYLTDKRTWGEQAQRFHPQEGSHYIDLEDGTILVVASFADEASEIEWEGKEGVHPLPDPAFEGSSPLCDYAQARVSALVGGLKAEGKRTAVGAGKLNVLDVARAAGARHPLMKIRGVR